MFRDLNAAEVARFRKWARDNYKPFQAISEIWHPIVADECAAINREADAFVAGSYQETSNGGEMVTGVYPTFRVECSE